MSANRDLSLCDLRLVLGDSLPSHDDSWAGFLHHSAALSAGEVVRGAGRVDGSLPGSLVTKSTF